MEKTNSTRNVDPLGFSESQKRVGYNYFRGLHLRGLLTAGFKDDFLQDREQWDDLQKELISEGFNMLHDDVKGLVTNLDKGGYLGGVVKGASFKDQHEQIEKRKANLKKYGHNLGIEGISSDLCSWAEKSNSPLKKYYQDPGWTARSLAYRASVGWTCELCLKDHSGTRHRLHAHHLTYTLKDGSSAIYNETDRELMALCDEPCHVLADIVRMIRGSKLSWPGSAEALSLFEIAAG